ncbi:MAG TPA: response regulator transcription factor [Bryobacteraceae bacterium]|jgi:two-component system nitrate/nitrite response regulator NarL
MMGRVTALLVDDHAAFGESVARALSAEPDFDVLYCATIADALRILQQQPINVVLLDYDLGSERASQFLPSARQLGFAGRVLIVTAWVSDTEARRLLRQGVAGIFIKESSLSVLSEAIYLIEGGGVWLDRRYRNLATAEQHIKRSETRPRFNERQRRVLRYVLEGLSNKEIAGRLQISESYVKAILQTLFEKTGVRTRGQLVRVALEHYEDQL